MIKSQEIFLGLQTVEKLRIPALLPSSENAHLPEVSSATHSRRALNSEVFKSQSNYGLPIHGFNNRIP